MGVSQITDKAEFKFKRAPSSEKKKKGAHAHAQTKPRLFYEGAESLPCLIQPTQLALLEHRLQPTLPLILTGQDNPAVHCSMYPGE